MASKSYCDPNVNDYFEAMSFQDDEEKTWQEYTDFLVSKVEDLASVYKSLSIPIDIRAFGSSVEKLKIITPENIGDVDVMVFSLAEETKITESIMEYSIPDNPAFVRLRGKDDPILQHCLAENSDYVASVTLKDFHPKVFGQSVGFFHILPKIFQKMRDIPSYEMLCVVQSTGPSIQCNISQTRGSLLDHVAELKGLSNFKTNDEVRGFLEWMAIASNPGKPFTDEHRALVNETSKYVEEAVQRAGQDPSIQNFSNLLEEITTGPKAQALRTKFHELNTKAADKEQNEPSETQERLKQGTENEKTGRSPETEEVEACTTRLEPKRLEDEEELIEREQDPETGEPEGSASQAKPEGRDENEETEREQDPETGEPEGSASQAKPEGRDENEETEREQDPETGEPEGSASQAKPEGRDENEETEREQDPETGGPKANNNQIETKGLESVDNESNALGSDNDLHSNKDSPNVTYEQVTKEHSGSRLQEGEVTVKAVNSKNPSGEGEETDLKKMTEQIIFKHCIENFLQLNDPSKSQEELQKEYLEIAEDQTRQKGGLDIVPAFQAKGWPAVARGWILRDRLWPNQNVISSILDCGFHLVAKTPNESDRPDLDFRLSFSHAELVLSKELNGVQRQCYRCFKLYHLTIIRNRKPKTLTTYFLKTILFWAIEETGMEVWNSENRGNCVMMLLRKLLKALETKFLAHFFIPEFNLLKDVAKEFPEEMKFLAEEVRKVCEDPMSYPNASVEEDQDAKAIASLERMTDPSAVEIGSFLTTARSGRVVDANLPSKEDVSTNNRNSTTLAKSNDPDSTTRATSPFFLRFKDYQALYRQVYQEMLDLALSDETVDTKDHIISSIVTNMRKVMEKMATDPRKEMEVVLEHSLENGYTCYLFHTGSTQRDRMLSMLRGQSEMFAYIVRQEDLAPGNEHAIVNRMLNSSSDGSSDPFDMSILYPEGGNILANVLEVLDAQFKPKKQSLAIDDDIPLD